VITVLIILFLAAIFAVVISLVFGAIYVPSVNWVIDDMVSLANVKKGEKVVDLGSGDGRIVIAFAKRGADAVGYEFNPFLVLWSKYKIWRSGVNAYGAHAHVYWKSFWNEDLSKYHVVVLFLSPLLMKRLEEKLQKELRSKTRVISATFQFRNWKSTKRLRSTWFYIR